jgi:hypothetical protein
MKQWELDLIALRIENKRVIKNLKEQKEVTKKLKASLNILEQTQIALKKVSM